MKILNYDLLPHPSTRIPQPSSIIHQPIAIGDLLRKLFIIRPDGSVDHDMVVALAQAAQEHERLTLNDKRL